MWDLLVIELPCMAGLHSSAICLNREGATYQLTQCADSHLCIATDCQYFLSCCPVTSHCPRPCNCCAEVKSTETVGPVLIHIITQKGKGYLPAETASDKMHGVGTFNIKDGKAISKPSSKPKVSTTYTALAASALPVFYLYCKDFSCQSSLRQAAQHAHLQHQGSVCSRPSSKPKVT